MGKPKKTAAVVAKITIADNVDVGNKIERLDWVSFVNGGYTVQATIHDPGFKMLKNLATKDYLKKARKEPTPLRFSFGWVEGDKTPERLAYITKVIPKGAGSAATLTFIGIDPPSWWLNAGPGDGSAWKGNVSKVIKDVCKKYYQDRENNLKGKSPDVEVSKTEDSEENYWYMMRMDPKSFILSLLEWSASFTENKTHWIVASVDDKLIIKEQADLKPDKTHYYAFAKKEGGNHILNVEALTENVLSLIQSRLITQGISSLSGEFFDKVTHPGEGGKPSPVIVRDENTQNKRSPKLPDTKSFKKPDEDWATSIMAIPEHSGGETGVDYLAYIDGRARGKFLNMLNALMRARFTSIGDWEINDSSKLGVTKFTVDWLDIDSESYWLGGNWLMYGFHHTLTPAGWETNLYGARLDSDAKIKPI